jgi:hypothetical protein
VSEAIELVEMYVIYCRPKDHPNLYVLRKWHLGSGGMVKPDDEYALGETLDEIRSLIPNHCVCIGRQPEDDRVIVESWV